MTTATGLARVTIAAPARRLDVALPEHVPLAELLPELLRHAGEGLPDAGQQHGGWVLRRGDGRPLSVGAGLASQGVRDGDLLHLAPARTGWPELEYDDVVDAIAAGTRARGRVWDGSATRLAGLAVAGVALLLVLVELFGRPAGGASAVLAASVSVLLLLAGVIAARAYADAVVGATVGVFALPFVFAAGYLVWRGTPGVLVGGAALLLAGVVGSVGVGYALRVFAAAVTVGCLTTLGALLAYWQPAAAAAAVVLAVLVTGVAAYPVLAIRLARLPMPMPAPDAPVPPERARILAGVARADELVTGMLLGHAVVGLGAAALLVGGGGVSGRVLVGLAAVGFLVRARLFPAVRQRLPLLVSGVGAAAVLLARGTGLPWPVPAGTLVGLALLSVIVGASYGSRAPGPYLGRMADTLDVLCTVSVIPVACAVLGLYGRMRGLIP